MSAFAKGWKEATREAAKAAGHYDGRFAPKAYVDRYHASNKTACRVAVEVEVYEEEIFEEAESVESASWTESVSFSPFAALL